MLCGKETREIDKFDNLFWCLLSWKFMIRILEKGFEMLCHFVLRHDHSATYNGCAIFISNYFIPQSLKNCIFLKHFTKNSKDRILSNKTRRFFGEYYVFLALYTQNDEIQARSIVSVVFFHQSFSKGRRKSVAVETVQRRAGAILC